MDDSNLQHASRNIARSGSRSRSSSPYAKGRSLPYPRAGEATERKQRRYSRSRSPRGTTSKTSPHRKRSPRSRSPYSRRRSSSRSISPTRGSSRGHSSHEHDNGGRGGRGRGRGGPRHESTFRRGSGPGDRKPDVWGSKIQREEEEERKKKPVIAEEDKEKPNFGLSGSLAAETNTTVSGAVLKYNEPPEARKPSQKWRLYVFKGDKEIDLLHIHRQSAFLFGRDRNVVDVPIDHPSCSKQHAVLQFRQIVETDNLGQSKRTTKPFIIDLGSANGTSVNGAQIPATRYYELKLSDVIKFGASTREFVLLHE
ncbi:hypothetical protein MVEG_00294 [Podila verticillata NRRL 6337]|nr:hypothetical protein MVEG_00294 [Podila verticillata NRRL 6337]